MPETHDAVQENGDARIQAILSWLALAHGKPVAESVDTLRQHIQTLRTTKLPGAQGLKVLDLLHAHGSKCIESYCQELQNLDLPVPRKTRQVIRNMQDMQEMLAQDYLNALAEQLNPEQQPPLRPPEATLWRIIKSLVQHLCLSYLVSAPPTPGIWQQLHSAFRTARELKLDQCLVRRDSGSLEQEYLLVLMLASAQPAAFTSREVMFILQYLRLCLEGGEIVDYIPMDQESSFWLDPLRDNAPCALARKAPLPDNPVLYFSLGNASQRTIKHLQALENGETAISRQLPLLADTPEGRSVLRRLALYWGHPGKRRFPRRRQSYRVAFISGLAGICSLLNASDQEPEELSEWMVTNESPDGLAIMHVSGRTGALKVGEIVAIQPENQARQRPWQICLVRWALSENPEHIELGLQILSPRALPLVLRQPELGEEALPGLLLPIMPPLRAAKAIVAPTSLSLGPGSSVITLAEKKNLRVSQFQATSLDEQTPSVAILTVALDDSP